MALAAVPCSVGCVELAMKHRPSGRAVRPFSRAFRRHAPPRLKIKK